MKTRYETKYILDLGQFESMFNIFSEILDRDSFSKNGPYSIISDYLDTPNLDLFYQNIEGEFKHRKFRIRSYSSDFSGPCWIEGKIKNNNLQIKKREKFENYLLAKEAIKDSDSFFHFINIANDLSSKGHVLYNREAFETEDKKLRVTFDTEIMYRKNEKSSFCSIGPQYLMEIKYKDFNLPGWLSSILLSSNITRSSFSKYTAGVSVFNNKL